MRRTSTRWMPFDPLEPPAPQYWGAGGNARRLLQTLQGSISSGGFLPRLER